MAGIAPPLLAALAAVLASLASPRPLVAQAGLLVPTRTGRPDATVLALREMRIDAAIARGHAQLSLREVFENRTGLAQEGTYRFRLPPGATVSDFAVWDGLVRVPGVILEKRRARGIYRELTAQRIDPGLLQQGEEDEGAAASGGAAFSARVSPVPPWGTKRVEVQLQQEVRIVSGRGEMRLALKPADGEPPVAGRLAVRVRLLDAEPAEETDGLPLRPDGAFLVFEGRDVRLDRDLVVRFRRREGEGPLRLSAFRNPAGVLPDTVAVAPWERAGDVAAPEKDGFFLLELTPPASPAAQAGETTARPPITLALVFDTSLSVRWSSLETGYARLVRALDALSPRDRFALVAFDKRPAVLAPVGPASAERRRDALAALRARPLSPGSDVASALAEARRAAGDRARVLLLTDGPRATSATLSAALAGSSLFTALAGEETKEAYSAASVRLLPPGAAEAETDLFFLGLVSPAEGSPPRTGASAAAPFTFEGGDPRIRDVYPVLAQPPAPGSESGWIGRYEVPLAAVRVAVASPLLPGGRASLDGALPAEALEARDLPRRWARARVDHLLAIIEKEGERREWVDEVVALSKRYRFVTPYTAFLAAPRALLRPRRIQPGDPVLRVECDPATVAATALLPFGERLALVRRPGTTQWEGRFFVPAGFADGRYAVRLLLRDASGAVTSETKHLVIDGRAPDVRVELPPSARAGEPLRLAVRTDEDVIALSARLDDGPPVPLRWDDASRRSVGTLTVPSGAAGVAEVFVEAVDAAHNLGFARARVEVRP
jgi:Ca-activated chloride channel family protein